MAKARGSRGGALVAVEDPELVAARQRNYKARRRERHEVRVSVWVPADKAQRLREIATMWRRQAELADGVTSPTPPVRVPEVEIPELPPPGFAWVRLKREERAMQMLLKANGAEWHKDAEAWRLRSDMVDKLGVRNRVCDWDPGARS